MIVLTETRITILTITIRKEGGNGIITKITTHKINQIILVMIETIRATISVTELQTTTNIKIIGTIINHRISIIGIVITNTTSNDHKIGTTTIEITPLTSSKTVNNNNGATTETTTIRETTTANLTICKATTSNNNKPLILHKLLLNNPPHITKTITTIETTIHSSKDDPITTTNNKDKLLHIITTIIEALTITILKEGVTGEVITLITEEEIILEIIIGLTITTKAEDNCMMIGIRMEDIIIIVEEEEEGIITIMATGETSIIMVGMETSNKHREETCHHQKVYLSLMIRLSKYLKIIEEPFKILNF